MRTKEEILNRIEEIKKLKNSMTGQNSKSKYSYTIGELEWVIYDDD